MISLHSCMTGAIIAWQSEVITDILKLHFEASHLVEPKTSNLLVGLNAQVLCSHSVAKASYMEAE